MKINKKTKFLKLTTSILTLSSIAILPIVLTACGSKSDLINILSTTLENNYSAKDNIVEKAPSDLVKNMPLLKKIVFENMIKGYKKNLSANNLNIDIISENDEEGTLIFNAILNSYWKNNVLLSEKIIFKNLSISNLSKKTKATIFKDDLKLEVSQNSELSKLSVKEIFTNNIELKSFILKNAIFGNKLNININNIILVNLYEENVELGSIKVKYFLNGFWTNNGFYKGKSFDKVVTISGLKKIILTNQEKFDLLKVGGELYGLKYSSFFPIVSLLNLKQDFRLNNLDDELINQIISKQSEYVNLKIKIKYGDQSRSKLILSISGTYNSINIPND